MPASSARPRAAGGAAPRRRKASGAVAAGGEGGGDPRGLRLARARAARRRSSSCVARAAASSVVPEAVPGEPGQVVGAGVASAAQPRRAASIRCSGSGRGPRRRQRAAAGVRRDRRRHAPAAPGRQRRAARGRGSQRRRRAQPRPGAGSAMAAAPDGRLVRVGRQAGDLALPQRDPILGQPVQLCIVPGVAADAMPHPRASSPTHPAPVATGLSAWRSPLQGPQAPRQRDCRSGANDAHAEEPALRAAGIGAVLRYALNTRSTGGRTSPWPDSKHASRPNADPERNAPADARGPARRGEEIRQPPALQHRILQLRDAGGPGGHGPPGPRLRRLRRQVGRGHHPLRADPDHRRGGGEGPEPAADSFLRQIIGFYGDSMQSLVPRYLEAAMAAFARQQDQMRRSVEQAMGGFMPVPAGWRK